MSSDNSVDDDDTNEKGEIQVIVAGLGRTGTMSMQVALHMLGYQPYHMGAILLEPGHAALWRDRAQGKIGT